jgi:hypothetical protein
MSKLSPDVLSLGIQTAKRLKMEGIVSPDISNRIKISNNLWVVPNKPIKTEKQLREYIHNKRKQLKIIS